MGHEPGEIGSVRAVRAACDHPPMAHRRKRWSGQYIVVWSDNNWEFFRCCRCGQPLNDDASRKRGLGPGCKDHAALDEVWSIKRAEREVMREWLKAKRASPAKSRNACPLVDARSSERLCRSSPRGD